MSATPIGRIEQPNLFPELLPTVNTARPEFIWMIPHAEAMAIPSRTLVYAATRPVRVVPRPDHLPEAHHQMMQNLRDRALRKESLFESWWADHMPAATQTQAWIAYSSAVASHVPD